MTQAAEKRLAVLISGNGTNLQAILDACANHSICGKVVVVVSNKKNALGLVRAKNAGIPVLLKVKDKDQTRQQYDMELLESIRQFAPDWVVLAGWMRLLSSVFLGEFPGKVINIHPALPGTYPGIGAIEQAFQAFQEGLITETGVMVHLVPDEGVDSGPVLRQETVKINPGETLESLETRIHAVEHDIIVQTLAQLCNPPAAIHQVIK